MTQLIPPTALFLLLSLSGCGTLLQASTREHVPHSEVGTLTMGAPERATGGVTVPLSIQGGTWDQNSGLELCRVESQVSDREIELSVFRCLVDAQTPAIVPRIVLGAVSPGSYQVFYVDADGTRYPVGPLEIRR